MSPGIIQLRMFPQLFRTEMFPDWSDELKLNNPAGGTQIKSEWKQKQNVNDKWDCDSPAISEMGS